MIVALLAAGALACAAGTRGAAVAFIAAAGLAAGGQALPALTTWTAVTAAILVATDRVPRRIALPAFGAIAVIAAGSARNAAAVFGLWVLGTVAAVVSRGEGDVADRWSLTLCFCDLPVLAAVCWTGFRAGFEGWPSGIDGVGAVLLLIATAARAPLASGPSDDVSAPGLLPVRAQTVLLPLMAIGSVGPDSDLLPIWLIAGAAAMAVGGLAGREATRDAVQEVGLIAIVVAASRAGVGAQGWEWGVLGGATLMHTLRLRVNSQPSGPLAAMLLKGGGIGLPIFPASVVALEGGMRQGGWAGAGVALGVVGGLAARAVRPPPQDTQPEAARSGGRLAAMAGAAMAAIAVAAALWAPVFTFPRGSAARSVEWPPLWGGAVVLAAGIAAAAVGPRIPVRKDGPQRTAAATVLGELRVPAELVRPRSATLGAMVLVVSAVALWVVGMLRGFL